MEDDLQRGLCKVLPEGYEDWGLDHEAPMLYDRVLWCAISRSVS